MRDVFSIYVGDIRVTPISASFMVLTPSEFIDVNMAPSDDALKRELESPVVSTTFCAHVVAPGMSLLLDPSREHVEPTSPRSPPGLAQPPGMMTRLRERGVAPGDISHIVITHAHGDHISGLLDEHGDLQFPNAMCYLSDAEWDAPHFQAGLADPASVVARSFGALQRAHKLSRVVGDLNFGNGVSILAAPGETPGHQILRVQSDGQTLYCVGDLFHFTFEFAHPEFFANWKDPPSIKASRARFIERALAENAVVVATHIPEAGRLEATTNGARWVAA